MVATQPQELPARQAEEQGTFQQVNSSETSEGVMIHLTKSAHSHCHTGLDSSVEDQKPMPSPCPCPEIPYWSPLLSSRGHHLVREMPV